MYVAVCVGVWWVQKVGSYCFGLLIDGLLGMCMCEFVCVASGQLQLQASDR